MHHTLSSALSALVFLSISSCQSAPAPLTAADIDAQRALSQSFRDRVLAKDWDAVSQMYADSAIFMPPNSPAHSGSRGDSGMAWRLPTRRHVYGH